MRKLFADVVFPVSGPPVREAVLLIDNEGKVLDFISPDEPRYSIEDAERLHGLLCPGFINTHCHLELSYLEGKMKPGQGLNAFITDIEKEKTTTGADEIFHAMSQSERKMIAEGIVAVGDIMNSSASILIKRNKRLAYYSFIETYGSDPGIATKRFGQALEIFKSMKNADPQSAVSIVPHAPYSCSTSLLNKIKEFVELNSLLISIHHQESEDENLYFYNKGGAFPGRLNQMGVDISAFQATGKRPLESIIANLPSRNPFLLVHNTYSTRKDIEFVCRSFGDPWWCLCPNANLFIEGRLPDIPLFLEISNKICIGTDSLASNDHLSILDEMKTVQKHFPEITTERLLSWATINGADFLGLNSWAGTFEIGKRPGINLVENIDLQDFSLTRNSKIRAITSYLA